MLRYQVGDLVFAKDNANVTTQFGYIIDCDRDGYLIGDFIHKEAADYYYDYEVDFEFTGDKNSKLLKLIINV